MSNTPTTVVTSTELVYTSFAGIFTTSQTQSPDAEPLTLDTIYAAIERIKQLPPEPFKQWMLENGGDPDRGWVLLLPKEEYEGLNLPSYVKLSSHISEPIMLPIGQTQWWTTIDFTKVQT
jgi:hypothetical protein